MGRIQHGRSFHIVSSHPRHLLLFVLLLLDLLIGILIVETDRLVTPIVQLLIQHLTLFWGFLLGVGLDVLHDLRQHLLLQLLCVVGREREGVDQLTGELAC